MNTVELRTETSLDGEWQLTLDPEDAGRREGWVHTLPSADSLTVKVPSVWDLWVPDYDGVGWYSRTFDFQWSPNASICSLEFDAADYFADVWLNGNNLGSHEGGYTPFAFDATSAIRNGENKLVVRIIDPHGPNGFGDFRPREFPSAKEHGYWSFGGLWGSVKIITKPTQHIADVFVQPDLRRKRLAVNVATSQPSTVRVRVDGTSFVNSGATGAILLEMPEFETWSPAAPRLYTLICEIVDGDAVIDRVRLRFGMREFTVKDKRFHLNGRPILVKAVLHQPDYARTLAAPESPELARKELQLAKDAGFNMIRLHIKTPPRVTLELADELGLLVYEEPPIAWIKKSEFMKSRCMREVRDMILRDRNHPSVVIWGMLNESGNADYVIKGGAQLIKDDLCSLARSLDPSRLIIDDSGGVNATRESARMMLPYRDQFVSYDDLHIYQRAPVDNEIEQYYRQSACPDKLFFLSEFGFGGMEDLEDVIAQYGTDADTLKDARFLQKMLEAARQGFVERGVDRVFDSFAEFTAATRELQAEGMRIQLDAIRSNPKLGGYCYTQLCDAGHEFCAGLLDRWRRPKPVYEVFRDAQLPMRPLIQVSQTNLPVRSDAPLSVLMTNDDRAEGQAELSLQVVGPTNQVLWKKKKMIALPRTIKEVWNGAVSASGSPGVHRFTARVSTNGKVVSENNVDLHVFEPAKACDIPVYCLDPTGVWSQRCRGLLKEGTIQAPVCVAPPLANSIRAYPDEQLCAILANVREGASAIFFGTPADWNDLAEQSKDLPKATSRDAVGAFLGMYHYVKLHPVFEGLPARCLMKQVYRNIAPPKTFLEPSEEDICGTFDTAPIAAGNYMMGESAWWGSDILVCSYGVGRLFFTHLRIMENLGVDPVADRLFVNLIQHAGRRSVPSKEEIPVEGRLVEWLREERTNQTRKWMVVGMFPNWNDDGHDTVFPPETSIDVAAVYEGWYKSITWKPWFSLAANEHVVDLQEALTPLYQYYPRFDYGTGYAYSEFASDRRQDATLTVGVQDSTKVWLNGKLVFTHQGHAPLDMLDERIEKTYVRQGKNTLLVKVSKIPGQFRFSLDIKSAGKEPLRLKWWR